MGQTTLVGRSNMNIPAPGEDVKTTSNPPLDLGDQRMQEGNDFAPGTAVRVDIMDTGDNPTYLEPVQAMQAVAKPVVNDPNADLKAQLAELQAQKEDDSTAKERADLQAQIDALKAGQAPYVPGGGNA